VIVVNNEIDALSPPFALVSRRQVMFGLSRYSHAMSTNVRQIERRLRSLEQRVEGAAGRTSASAAEAAERVANAVAPLLNRVADHFRDGANSMSDEAAKLSNDALRRLSNEAKHRPLAAVAVAAGVGIVLGLASGRRSVAVRAQRARRSPRRRAA
jgi:ElaB/YqjD/DUF883 family membrane-anchored ribosome-binding protein